MPQALDGRSRRRLATRQAISHTATLLFFERGFDQVTVDEIAAAAQVGRMTVFNHFPRKEDLFFDLDEEGRQLLQEAMRRRDRRTSPIETFRRLAHRLVKERSPLVELSARSQRYIETIERSEALKARARAIGDELAEVVAAALCASVGGELVDAGARLAADLLVATWTVAFLEAHRTFRQTAKRHKAEATFLAIVDQGSRGVRAAMKGTLYA